MYWTTMLCSECIIRDAIFELDCARIILTEQYSELAFIFNSQFPH